MKIFYNLLAFLLCIWAFENSFGQKWTETDKTLPIPYLSNTSDYYGCAVSVDGVYAVVGARSYSNGQGCSYILHYTGTDWETLAKLTASDGSSEKGFGQSVSISGDFIAIGSGWDGDHDAAYIFKKPATGWTDTTETAKLTASDGATSDHFASSISISGDYVVVGATYNHDNSIQSGSAYIFTKPLTGWIDATETAKLTPSDGATFDHFGISVSISGDVVVIGADEDDDNGSNTGSAYIFKKPATGWANTTETAKLSASDKTIDDNFGGSVSISGDVVVIGAYFDDDNGTNSGSAYIFGKPIAGWTNATETAKLTASDGVEVDWFGQSVSISGDFVIVGASRDDDNGTESGSVYVFEKPVTGWTNITETAKLTTSDGEDYDYFGQSVSISGDHVISGVYYDNDNGENSGSAYLFKKPPTGWINATELNKQLPIPYLNNNGDQYGFSVSVDGDYAVAGANEHDNSQGCAYILFNTGANWETLAKLTASDGAEDDCFGQSVSISGDYVVIGAYYDDGNGTNSGSAYLFKKPESGWIDATETAKLTASDGSGDDRFGGSVAISGDYIVIGAYRDQVSALYSGSAYLFEKPPTGWTNTTETAKLTASDGAYLDYFGQSLSIAGDVVIIGALNDDDNGSESGSAYLFEKPFTGWANVFETAKFTSSDGAEDDNFGSSVSISGDYIVVGASSNDGNSYQSGSAYIFEKPVTGWTNATESAKFTASDGTYSDHFGSSVSISGDYIAIGAYNAYGNINQCGSAYIFEKPSTGWTDTTETAKLIASDGAHGNYFGSSVSMSGDYAFIGAKWGDGNGSSSGSAYFFQTLPNNPPTDIILDNTSIDENILIGDFVGSFSTEDVDAGDTHSYMLATGNGSNDVDNNKFLIDGNTLKTATNIDYETQNSFFIYVQTDDGDEGTFAKSFVITVNNLNDNTPVLNDNTFTIDENSTNSLIVGTITGTDGDGDLNELAYSIVSGNTNNAFALNSSTGEITVNDSLQIDFETIESFDLSVQVTDGTNTNNALITINLNNLNDNSPVINGTSFAINENSSNGKSVGTQPGTDADGNLNNLTYSILSGNTNETFVINSSTGEIGVNDSTLLDFEITESFILSIQLSDGTYTDNAPITINLNNLNDNSPVIDGTTFSIDENSSNGTSVGTQTGTDADGNLNSLTYSILSGNTNDAFAINSSTGEIEVNDSTQLDFETTESFVFSIQLSDGTYTDNAPITIDLYNLNDNSPVIDGITFSINENSTTGTSVGTQTGTDADGNLNDLTYSILSGNTNETFVINSTTGEIIVNDSTQLDYETTESFILSIQLSDGTYTDNAPITIDLYNLNDNSPVIEGTAFSIDENSSNGTSVGTQTGTDADGDLNILTYSILSGNTNETFVINSSTGEISVNDSTQLDYETNESFILSVEVSDGLFTDTASISVLVNNIVETGINKTGENNIIIYPNPTQGMVVIKINNNYKPDLIIEIINIEGKVIYTKQFKPVDTKEIIDLSDYSKGIYLIKISNDKTIKVERLVIE